MNPASNYCQRWREGSHSWRHRSEGGFDKRRYEVALIPDDTTAKNFVVAHHYSRSFGAARIRTGLYRGGDLVGVAVLGNPTNTKVLTKAFPTLVPFTESLELSRFVLLNQVPANGETWLLGRTFRLAAEQGLRGVVSFADPVERMTPEGQLLSPGHVGIIYQASNGLYSADRSTARTEILLPNGAVFSDRTKQKILKQERGHRYAEGQLVEFGARPRRDGEDPRAWIRQALLDVEVQRQRHPGKHRYLFKLGTRAERSRTVVALTPAPYPKKEQDE